MLNNKFGPYEIIAEEYYDAARHPTCAALSEISFECISMHLPEKYNSVLEVGAGKSSMKYDSNANIVLTDISPSMLKFSNFGTKLICDAKNLPFSNNCFDLIVANLADPYNTIDFLREVRRVISSSGTFLFTVPSYAWAQEFREGDRFSAEFILAGGERTLVPSFVNDSSAQIQILNELFRIVDCVPCFGERNAAVRSAPKLSVALSKSLPVIDLYVARA